MKVENVFIFDTNALVSAHLVKHSVSDQAFQKALQRGALGISQASMTELVAVV